MRDRQPPLPKPYEFVELPDRPPRPESPAGHHRYAADRYSGQLTATLIARSPVHVASGLLETSRDRTYPMVKAQVRSNGVPIIPGTSLKGCIRSIVEAISDSAVQVTRAGAIDNRYKAPRSPERLDVAGRIFGALGYQGLVSFADAVLKSGNTTIVPTPQLYRPRSDSVDTYFDGNRPYGRKFYMHGNLAGGDLPLEACPVDSRFTLTMHFENLSAAELGLVLTGLGLGEPRLWPKLGGGKPACLGTIEVAEPQLTGFSGAGAYTDFDSVPQPIVVAPLLEAARSSGLIRDAQLRKLATILAWPREDRNCPHREY